MDKTEATTALFALSQTLRLDIFRLLVQAGAHGRLPGELAVTLGIRQNTLSNNLSVLLNAGLIRRTREGRNLRYTADTEAVRDLLSFVLEGCCQTRPDLCHPLLERAVRRMEAPGTPGRYNVLFLCNGNSARSLMAEAIVNGDRSGQFHGYSAGAHPAATGPHPFTLDLLHEFGHDTSAIRSKPWEEFIAPGAPRIDFVFTVCDKAAADLCPVWPSQPICAHWGVPAPAVAGGTEAGRRLAFCECYRMLRSRIATFMNLPLATLDRFALQRRLDEIGQADAVAEGA